MSNKVSPITHYGQTLDQPHYILDAFRTITPGTPYLFLFVISLIVKLEHHLKFLKKNTDKSRLQELNSLMKEANYKDEPNYYNAIAAEDRAMLME